MGSRAQDEGYKGAETTMYHKSQVCGTVAKMVETQSDFFCSQWSLRESHKLRMQRKWTLGDLEQGEVQRKLNTLRTRTC